MQNKITVLLSYSSRKTVKPTNWETFLKKNPFFIIVGKKSRISKSRFFRCFLTISYEDLSLRPVPHGNFELIDQFHGDRSHVGSSN
jgi:hypothetical protein